MSKHAESIRAELEEIAREHDGMLRCSDVVDHAEDPSTALHKEFEWDESVAATAYRLHQAEKLIRSVRVTLEPRPDVHLKVRAYVSLPRDRGIGYRQMQSVLGDHELREELLAEARAELAMFERKYATLEELTGVIAAIRTVIGGPDDPGPQKKKKPRKRRR